MQTKWRDILPPETLRCSASLLQKAQAERDAGKHIYPPQDVILRALTLTPPDRVKVVIIGQDPYHQYGQANGLAFSVAAHYPNEPGRPLRRPPSLENIFTELENDLGIPSASKSNDLTGWAEQGVLLLNTSLTVEESKPASHSNWGWQELTSQIIAACLEQKQPIMFLLWGNHAKNMMEQACSKIRHKEYLQNKMQIVSTHPSPFSARKAATYAPAFIGSRPFSQTNKFLTDHGVTPIDWSK